MGAGKRRRHRMGVSPKLVPGECLSSPSPEPNESSRSFTCMPCILPHASLSVHFSKSVVKHAKFREKVPTLNTRDYSINNSWLSQEPRPKDQKVQECQAALRRAKNWHFSLHKILNENKSSSEFFCAGILQPKMKSGKPLRVGTDCSGIEAPIQALQNLQVPFEHIFSCDSDASCRKTIEANFPPKHFYDDIRSRDNSKVASVDLYVAGFPCQPFSSAGKKQGFADSQGRGEIFSRFWITSKSNVHQFSS